MQAKILAGVIRAKDFEGFLPYMCRSSYWDVDIDLSAIDKMRRGVAATFANLAKQFAAMTKKSD
jgi:hypothetical protein